MIQVKVVIAEQAVEQKANEFLSTLKDEQFVSIHFGSMVIDEVMNAINTYTGVTRMVQTATIVYKTAQQ